VNYAFANGVPLSFTCIQTIPEMRDEIVAARTVRRATSTRTTSAGVDPWQRTFPGRERRKPLYRRTVININEFHAAVVAGRCENLTVAPSVRSNLTAVLGREAGYRGGEFTLAELVQAGQKLTLDYSGLKT